MLAHSAPTERSRCARSCQLMRAKRSPEEDGEPERVAARRLTEQEEDGEPERVAARRLTKHEHDGEPSLSHRLRWSSRVLTELCEDGEPERVAARRHTKQEHVGRRPFTRLRHARADTG